MNASPHALATLTAPDRATLSRLLALRKSASLDVQSLVDLSERVEQADVVSPAEIPPSVVTLNSRVRLRMLGSHDERIVTLVVPGHSDMREGRVSVLTPVGTALVGRQEGDVVECTVPAGRVQFRIEAVLYQPEDAEADRAAAA